MTWHVVLELIERREALRINSERDLLTDKQRTILARLANEEITAILGLRSLVDFDD